MITDVHTHFWSPDHQRPPWTDGLGRVSTRLAAGAIDTVTVESYRQQVLPAARTIVFGLQAQASGIMVPNDAVAAFVREVGGQTAGFMSVDPTRHDAVAEIERCHADLGLRGIKLGPIYQGTFDANPLLLDDVAIAFPELRIVIAHMGHPWVHEAVVVMRRHKYVYADTSAIANRPTVLATGLSAAKEYGVLDKVLFGSDSPMVSAESAAAALARVVAHMQQFALTPITDEELQAILHRPSFELLGIPAVAETAVTPSAWRGATP
ncbi:MAG: amidohydrolase family protein [Trebonia sp.]